MNPSLATLEHYSQPDSLQMLERFAGRALVLCDQELLGSEALARVTGVLGGSGCSFRWHPVPKVLTEPVLAELLGQMLAGEAQLLVALGGRSALDGVKFLGQAARLLDRDRVQTVALPMAFTQGAEWAPSLQLGEGVETRSLPLNRAGIQAVICDPNLVPMPTPAQRLTDAMATVALTLDAYVASSASDFSDALAEKAMGLLVRHLASALDNPQCPVLHRKMLSANTLGALAAAHTGMGFTQWLAQGASRALGESPNSVLGRLAAPCVRCLTKSPRAQKRYARLARGSQLVLPALGDSGAVNQLVCRLGQWQRHFPVRGRGLSNPKGRQQRALEVLSHLGALEQGVGVPRQPDEKEMKQIIEAIL